MLSLGSKIVKHFSFLKQKINPNNLLNGFLSQQKNSFSSSKNYKSQKKQKMISYSRNYKSPIKSDKNQITQIKILYNLDGSIYCDIKLLPFGYLIQKDFKISKQGGLICVTISNPQQYNHQDVYLLKSWLSAFKQVEITFKGENYGIINCLILSSQGKNQKSWRVKKDKDTLFIKILGNTNSQRKQIELWKAKSTLDLEKLKKDEITAQDLENAGLLTIIDDKEKNGKK